MVAARCLFRLANKRFKLDSNKEAPVSFSVANYVVKQEAQLNKKSEVSSNNA